MWFKNLRIYRLTTSINKSPEELNEALTEYEFQPCGNTEMKKYGWTPPLGDGGSEFVHSVNGYIMICAKRQKKLLPAAVVNEKLKEQVAEISNRESRKVGRNEKQSLKEDVLAKLLPKAFTKSSYEYAYIDTNNQLIIVDSSSSNNAEELLSTLRESLGTLKAVPLSPAEAPISVLTKWLIENETPVGFEVLTECELSDREEGRSVKIKNQELWVDEVIQHIQSGLQVSKLAVNWNESINCIIDEQFCFKRVKFSNALAEQAQDHGSESLADKFDVNFSIMSLELSAFINAALDAFGGEAEREGLQDGQ